MVVQTRRLDLCLRSSGPGVFHRGWVSGENSRLDSRFLPACGGKGITRQKLVEQLCSFVTPPVLPRPPEASAKPVKNPFERPHRRPRWRQCRWVPVPNIRFAVPSTLSPNRPRQVRLRREEVEIGHPMSGRWRPPAEKVDEALEHEHPRRHAAGAAPYGPRSLPLSPPRSATVERG